MKSIILKGKIEELNIRSVSEMRARAIGAMIDVVSEVIRKNIDDILSGRLNVSLTDAVRKENETVANAFEALKALAAKEIYTERRVLQVEYAGFKIIGGLLDAFAGPLINFTEKKHMSASEKKILTMFPKSYLALTPEQYESVNQQESHVLLEKLTKYERMLAVTDYVSGMTDSYALELHQILTGIRIP